MKTSLSSRKPDYSDLERNIIILEKKKNKEMSFYNDVASLIAYQQMLCSQLGIVHTNLSNIVPQIRRPFPLLPFSNLPISMPETSRIIKLLVNITKLLWATIASSSESADIFINVHTKFNDLILTRNKFILMSPGPRLNSLFKESNGEKPANDEKNKNFSKAFNLTIKGNEKINDSFLPSDSNLIELEDKVGSEPNEEKLKSLLEDLSITQKELYNSIDEFTKSNISGNYFKKFPDFSIVQEIPQFTEAISSVGSNTKYVRSELYEYSKIIANTLQYLREAFEKFENCFALPQMPFESIKHLAHIESQHYMAIRKANFFRNIIRKARMKPPHEWTSLKFLENELHFLESIKSSIVSQKFDEISNLINSHFENLSNDEISENIKNETNASRDAKANAETASSEWLKKSTKDINDTQNETKYKKSYEEALFEADIKEKRNNQMRYEIYSNLENTIGRAKKLIYHLSDSPIIPPTFEEKMNVLVERKARIEALKMKAAAMNKDINAKREEIEKLKKRSALIDRQLQQKRDEYEGYKQKSESNKNIVVDTAKSLEEFEKYEDLYFCHFHPKERREIFLRECKHSFCKKCTKIQIKERNRKCPYCHEPFNQFSDIIEINWDKKQ